MDFYYIGQLELQSDLKAFLCNCFKVRKIGTFQRIKTIELSLLILYQKSVNSSIFWDITLSTPFKVN
jgi:hypothetical protein